MKHVLSLLLITGALALCACSKKSDNNSPQGGVDGSGGDLQTISDDEITHILQNSHKYYLRDVIHRLYLIKANSPDDFAWTNDLIQKFLDIDQETFQKEISNIQFTLAPGRCSSANSGDQGSDAAYSPGNICISYAAFKKIPIESLIPKLITLSLHELGHMRGFNEDEAVRLQKIFDEYPLGEKTIFWSRSQYTDYFETLSNLDMRLGIAYDVLVGREADSKTNACSQITIAGELSRRLHLAFIVPTYMKRFVDDKLLDATNDLADGCTKRSEVETFKLIGSLMKDLNTLNHMLLYYVSPLCKDFACTSESLLFSSQNILSYNEYLPYVEKGEKPTPVDMEQVHCKIKNLKDGKEVPLHFDRKFDNRSWENNVDLAQHFPDLKSFSFYLQRDFDESSAKVVFDKLFEALPVKLDGFAPYGSQLGGGFYTNSKKEISAVFSTFESERAFIPQLKIYSANKEIPAVRNTYELRCSFGE